MGRGDERGQSDHVGFQSLCHVGLFATQRDVKWVASLGDIPRDLGVGSEPEARRLSREVRFLCATPDLRFGTRGFCPPRLAEARSLEPWCVRQGWVIPSGSVRRA